MSLTTAQVLQRFLPAYRHTHKLTPQQAKVTNLLCACHTQALGGYTLRCDDCGHCKDYFHSCRNRHCPQCQRQASEHWLLQRQQDLLPVPYFHVVFTLPHTLNGWVQLHPEVLYRLFFQAVSSTLKTFGRDPKRLNGELGWTSVLHTWGQNLNQHVHTHCLIPGGAFNTDTQVWREARSTYLFPVKALSRRVRGVLVSSLRKAYDRGELSRIEDHAEVDRVLNTLMHLPWGVFSKPTYGHTDTVLGYLAQYTYRIAISDRRLLTMDENSVSFKYKDYADDYRQKVMALQGTEFVRRFLLHVLPQGFMRIRHYGFMVNCQRRRKLAQIRQSLSTAATSVSRPPRTCPESAVAVKAVLPTSCPRCHCTHIRIITREKIRKR